MAVIWELASMIRKLLHALDNNGLCKVVSKYLVKPTLVVMKDKMNVLNWQC